MFRVLFWNTAGREVSNALRNLVHGRSVDLLLLAESAMPPAKILSALNAGSKRMYRFVRSNCPRITIFARLPVAWLGEVLDTDHLTIRRVTLPALEPFLIGAVHLRSKLYQSPASAMIGLIQLAERLRRTEERLGTDRTVLIGDFNANPFEDGMLAAHGLHAVMCAKRAARVSRVVDGEVCRFFYNPMWGLYGDLSPGPPGTYHRSSAEEVNPFWNMYDQVLVRPALLPAFRPDELTIITEDGAERFLTRSGTPNRRQFSDHLPVLFGLDL